MSKDAFRCDVLEVYDMRPIQRKMVHKSSSARKFRSHTQRTKSVNMRPTPMRGGWRL